MYDVDTTDSNAGNFTGSGKLIFIFIPYIISVCVKFVG